MKQAGIVAYFYGGYYTEAGLIARQSKEQGLNAVQIGGDALSTDEYWSITGAAGDGNLMTFPPEPRNIPAAQGVVAEFKKQGYDPEGYTLFTYAVMQVFAQAATAAKSTKLEDLSKALHAGKFQTVLGTLGFNAKGDVIGPGYVVYTWHDGKRVELKSARRGTKAATKARMCTGKGTKPDEEIRDHGTIRKPGIPDRRAAGRLGRRARRFTPKRRRPIP